MQKNSFSLLNGKILCNFVRKSTFQDKMEPNKPTILVADSGNTKTDWALADVSGSPIQLFSTQGINPVHQTSEAIAETLSEAVQKVAVQPSMVFFYGAGIMAQNQPFMRSLLSSAFPIAEQVCAESDLLGAARALCRHSEGIACILGTGANSCLYDGERIVQNTPPLGYILGDEGSGAVLGRMFFNALFKGALPEAMRDDYLRTTGLTYADIIRRVYREPMANRFLASTSLYISAHIADSPELHQLVTDNFRQFLCRNVAPYRRLDLPVNAVGSMAWHYREQLLAACHAEGFTLGTVVKSPIAGMMEYHVELRIED